MRIKELECENTLGLFRLECSRGGGAVLRMKEEHRFGGPGNEANALYTEKVLVTVKVCTAIVILFILYSPVFTRHTHTH